ncbi:10109_t:CDS:2 [Acaulospora colombiana]|uniref:10109_t:CDS:1 n=1 Tax=Acaulospora colombiana TaxID=27376 RepID=A0ACA9JUU0_9GLOM|nr:10109_t:CDS:2 [Acaulospora colombiana]
MPETSQSSAGNSDWNVHIPYHSIETISNEKRIEIFKNENLLNVCDWVVTEKIHGSNFSFQTDGKQIKCASRSRTLKETEEFFGFQNALKKYRENLLNLWEIINSRELIRTSQNEKVIIVYGELFGGKYSHPDVKPVPGSKIVQFGIEYCPQNEFMAFDIFDGSDYLEYDTMVEVLEESGLPYLKPLFRGTFNDAYNYDPEFTTTIPTILGLPQLPYPNKAEGVILKPVKTLRTKANVRQTRVVFKIKTPDFVERVRSSKRQNAKLNQRISRESIDSLIEEFDCFVNSNRFANVISKYGPIVKRGDDDDEIEKGVQFVEEKELQKIAELLFNDAMEDFKKDEELMRRYEELPERQKNIIKKRGKAVAYKVSKEYVLNVYKVNIKPYLFFEDDGFSLV